MEKEPDTINRTVNCLPSMPALPHETGTQNKVCVLCWIHTNVVPF